ncbi:MAG: Zn-dependent exopeptidase M28 [Clostridiales bacterium]|jgi:hypothetical protein|nr:Zn-dependent exopeptidase M28 [Clostridiales bacterium]
MGGLLDFVRDLGFVRVGGSKEEKTAANMILGELGRIREESRGRAAPAESMPFAIPSASVKKCSVKALGRSLACAPFLRSGSIDRECRLLYLDHASEIDFAGIGDLSGTAVLLNELLRDEEPYKRLAERKAAAFLVMKGKYYDTAETASLYGRVLQEHFARNGAIPGFTITAADANALVQENAQTVRLALEQENTEGSSQNLLAAIEGGDLKGESVVLTAHYDSVPVGAGAWDNATGAAALLAIYRHFAANPPRRTLRFVWCGSEELGLLGSKAYVAEHASLLGEIRFCFNFDMCGTALGGNDIFATGEKELETFIEQYCKLAGYSAKIRCGVQSSDSAPFCDHGIPALGLSRGTSAAEIHTIRDLPPTLSESAIRKNVGFAVRIIGDVANAAVIPAKKRMPEERRKELDKYFHREEKIGPHWK